MVFREHLWREGVEVRLKATGAGTGGWHIGDGAVYRCAALLAENGYLVTHAAAHANPDELKDILLIALDAVHERSLQKLVARSGGDPSRLRILRSFDPNTSVDLDVPDPYYGRHSGFTRVLRKIEASMPGLVDYVRRTLESREGPA